MIRDQKIERIRQACIAANSEIITHIPSPCNCREGYHSKTEYRPIRLADVLLAIQATKMESWLVDYKGYFAQELPDTKKLIYAPSNTNWNPRADDLTLQSDECIDFVDSLLIDK